MSEIKTKDLTKEPTIVDTYGVVVTKNAGVTATVQILFSTIKTWIKSWIVKADVGLGNVDNTSDANKPVSSAQSVAIGLKEDASNKSTSTADVASSVKFPVWTAIVSYIESTDAALVTLTGAQTLEDKRITSRVYSGVYNASLAVDSDLYDCAVQTALAGAISIDNPTGTPTDFQPLVYRIKDNGTSRAITWDTDFEATFVALPTATTISKVLVVGFWYDTVKAKWCCINSIEEL